MQPEFITGISEDSPPGTQLSDISKKVFDTDGDQLNYKLDTDGLKHCTIGTTTGILSLSKSIDREEYAGGYNFYITISDPGGSNQEVKLMVYIFVDDINDNPPIFQDPLNVAISEVTKVNSTILTLKTTDADFGTDNTEYSLETESKIFSLNADSGSITLLSPLDFESNQTTFLLRVKATDGKNASLFSTATVRINVTNDLPPMFLNDSYHASLMEDTTIGSEVVRVLARDQDTEVDNEIIYSIEQGSDEFTINQTTGALTLVKNLDHEKRKLYSLVVKATEVGEPTSYTLHNISIDVLDVNEFPPVFPQQHYTIYILPDTPSGYVIVEQFNVTDPDQVVINF
jgi:hypothetical protein